VDQKLHYTIYSSSKLWVKRLERMECSENRTENKGDESRFNPLKKKRRLLYLKT
jgi:hypothetical protein